MVNEDLLYSRTFEQVYARGVRFTMDDLADSLGISKRTLYEKVSSKEQLAFWMVERYFDEYEHARAKIYTNKNLTSLEKLRDVLNAMPVTVLDKSRLNEIKREYPAVFEEINIKLSRGWEKIFALIAEAQLDGFLIDFDEEMFKLMYVSSVESMLLGFNMSQELSFSQMQRKMVDILLNGIVCK